MRAEYARCTMRAKGWRPAIRASPPRPRRSAWPWFPRRASRVSAPNRQPLRLGSWQAVPRAAHWAARSRATRQQAISVERRGKVLGRGKAPLRFGLMAGPAVSAGHEENRDARGGGIPAHLVGQRKATAIGKSRVQDDASGARTASVRRPRSARPRSRASSSLPERLVNATSQHGIALDYQDVGRHGQGLYTAISYV